jgi:hypothetical protein
MDWPLGGSLFSNSAHELFSARAKRNRSLNLCIRRILHTISLHRLRRPVQLKSVGALKGPCKRQGFFMRLPPVEFSKFPFQSADAIDIARCVTEYSKIRM